MPRSFEKNINEQFAEIKKFEDEQTRLLAEMKNWLDEAKPEIPSAAGAVPSVRLITAEDLTEASLRDLLPSLHWPEAAVKAEELEDGGHNA